MNKLKHLAIIMDGNGRWAKKQGFMRTKGHESGAKVVEDVCRFCIEKEIEILSLYAFSTENWKRPENEVKFLIDLLLKFLISKREIFIKHDIKFKAIGDISAFNEKLKEEIINLENLTQENKKLKLNLAINYGAKDEILRAFKRLNEQNLELNEANLNACLDESEAIDLLVRTGGEQRLSNFMLWQASYAELAYTDTFWPDFTSSELNDIVDKFKNTKRRFGGL
ncbi:polyprenyl diphosphate synthase [Campylobacter sp. CCUG 57310]|uniref:polyprenyl diphosphate synthase n=1 Tax=Campylobacter sp. CCUG 57310 TaxID=2517362 RepID=UPI001565AE65|nr:polyprenyl diphosphate synthase [Campylobacter sp. CCUG 57310]QKF92302.1 undecaprenyl diphosphate synthetase [Campylobacter sp. CCUG 57310]